MNASPFYVLGSTHLSELRASLGKDLGEWVSAWFCEEVDAILEAVDVGSAASDDRHFRALKIEGLAADLWAVCVMDAPSSGRIGARLVRDPNANRITSSPTGLVQDLLREAFLDLARRMLAADGSEAFSCAEVESTDGALPADAFNPGREALRVLIELNDSSFAFWMPVAALAPRFDSPARSLIDEGEEVEFVQPEEFLADQRLSGRVILGEAELTLGVLANLSVGDVIQLEKKLQEPLSLEFERSPARFSGYLGRQGDRLVFQVDALL